MRPVTTASRWVKGLFYGGYGAGKTRLAGSSVLVPQMRDIFMIDAESGELTLSTIEEPDWGDLVQTHVTSVRITTFSELARVQEYLKLHCRYRDDESEEAETRLKDLEKKLTPEEFYDPEAPARRYYTCIIDSLSEVEAYSMYQLLGITDRSRLDDESMDQGWPEYRKNQQQILRTIRAYRDLPMHILMTSAAEFIQDDSKRMVHRPALTGKLAKQSQGFMDIVGFLAITNNTEGKEVRRLMAKPNPRWDAKCRFSNFKEPYWEDPTMKTILQSVGLLEGATATKK